MTSASNEDPPARKPQAPTDIDINTMDRIGHSQSKPVLSRVGFGSTINDMLEGLKGNATSPRSPNTMGAGGTITSSLQRPSPIPRRSTAEILAQSKALTEPHLTSKAPMDSVPSQSIPPIDLEAIRRRMNQEASIPNKNTPNDEKPRTPVSSDLQVGPGQVRLSSPVLNAEPKPQSELPKSTPVDLPITRSKIAVVTPGTKPQGTGVIPKNADYRALDGIDVRLVSKSDQRQMLEIFGLNTIGKPGDIQRRIYFLKELKQEALGFDLKHFDVARSTTRRLADRLNPKAIFESSPELEQTLDALRQHRDIDADEQDSMQQIASLSQLLRKYERTIFDSGGVRPSHMDVTQWRLKKLEEIFHDLRPTTLRMSHEDVTLDRKWSGLLGYTREQVLTKHFAHSQLQDIMRQHSLWRDEYENEDHLRRNMVLLIAKLMKEDKKRAAMAVSQKKQQPAALLGHGDSVDMHLAAIDKMRPGEIEDLAKELGLFPDFTDADYEMNFDLVEAKLQSYVERWHQKQRKAELSIQDVHQTLPTIDYDRTYVRGSSGIVHNAPAEAQLERVIRCKVSKVGDAEIREIGVRSDGYFSWGEEDELERAFRVEWHGVAADAVVKESAKKLDTFLESRTPAGETLRSLHLVVSEDEIFPIDIARNTLDGKYTSPYGMIIACKPLDLVDDEGVPFKRMVLQFKTFNQDVRQVVEKMSQCVDLDTQSPYRFGESGDVLAQAIELHLEYLVWAKRPHDDFQADGILCDRLAPSLLHYTSSYLRTHVFGDLNTLLREKWERELDVRNKYTPQAQAEAKRILLDMLLSAPEDKHVAVLTPVQLHYAFEDITKRTYHLHTSIYVERANLQVILRSLCRLNEIAGTIFIFLHLTGNISPFDLSRLIDQTKKGALRIFMTFSAALVSSLTLIGKIADVRVSHHAATSPDYSTATYHQYSVFTDVGAMVLHNERHFEAHPAQLRFKELEPYIDKNRQHTAWTTCERAWRELTLTREKYDEAAFALIVTRDTAVVRRYYDSLLADGDTSLSLIDCKVDDLDGKLNQICGATSDHPGLVRYPPASATKKNSNSMCLVVLNCNMLSDAHRRNIASRACQEMMRFVFVVPSFNPQHITMKFDDMSNQTRFLKGTMWHASPSLWDLQQTTEEVAKGRQADPESFTTVSEQALVCFRVLRLMFGSLVTMEALSPIINGLLCNRLYDDIEKFLGFGEIKVASSGAPEPTVLRDIIAVLQCYFSGGTTEACTSLHEAITLLCLDRVLSHSALENDVTFEQFVCNQPLCEWLSQRHRIEAYVRSVLMDPENPPLHLFPEWQVKDPFVTHFPLGFNVHSLNLYTYFRMETDRRPPIDIPSYQGTVKDVIVSNEEMLLQTCIQQQELNWAEVSSQWRTFPYGVDFLMTLLSFYHQPLKLLANCGRKNLFFMMENISGVTHRDVLLRLRHVLSSSNQVALDLIASQPSVAPFVSTLKWALISSGHITTADTDVAFDDTDLDHIIGEQIPITVRRKDASSSVFIIPVILRLPGPPEILYNQVGLREYFLGLKERETEEILEKHEYELGASLMDFIFHVAVRRHIKCSATYTSITSAHPPSATASPPPSGGSADSEIHGRSHAIGPCGPPPFPNHPFFGRLVAWLENAKSLVDARDPQFTQFVGRFTPSAFALLLSKANTLAQTDHLLSLVFTHMKAKSLVDSEATAFICALAQAALQRTQALTQIIHFLLSLPPELMPTRVNHPFIDLLMRSMRDRDLALLIDMYGREDDLPNLPVETNKQLRQLYVDYFQDTNIHNPDAVVDSHVAFHAKALSLYGNTCLFQTVCANAKVMEGSRLLLLVLWAMNPFQMCPIYPESDLEAALLRQLVDHTEVCFKGKVARNISTVSSFALYLCFPYYLDYQTMTDYDQKMYGRRQKKHSEETAYLIAQKGHTKWPSYQIRTHFRPLPQELIAIYDKHDFKVKKRGRGQSVEKLDFDVSSGVSQSIMSQNLNALAALMCVDHTDTRIFLGNVCLSWFYALGITDARMYRWGLPPEDRDNADLLESSPVQPFLQWIKDRPVNETAYTLHPLPSFLDLRVLKDRSCYRLFGASFEEAAYTLQYFETFLYSIPGAKEVIRDEQLFMPTGAATLIVETQSQGDVVSERTEDYCKVPNLASHVFGRCIRKYVDTMTQQENTGSFCHFGKYDLGQLESYVHPFTIALAAVHEESAEIGDKSVLDVMLQSFLQAVQSGTEQKDNRVKEALVHMALALRIGIFNSVLQDRVLQKCLQCRFAVAEQAVNEMIWCVEHKFISMPNLDAAKQTAITVQRNDELPILSSEAMSKWELSPCTSPLPETVISELSSHTKRRSWFANEGRRQKETNANYRLTQIFSSQTRSYAEGHIKNKQPRNTELNPLAHTGLLAQPPLTVFCPNLLEITSNKGFGILRVKPGRECFLMRTKHGQLHLSRCSHLQQGESVVASFPNNGIAWEYIQDLPPLSTLICEGFMLKKALTTQWTVAFAVYRPHLRDQDLEKGAHHMFRSWHILDSRSLFAFELIDEVGEFLLLICRYVYASHTGTHREMASIPVDRLLAWFEEHPEEGQLMALEDELRDLLLVVLDQLQVTHTTVVAMENLLRAKIKEHRKMDVFRKCQAAFAGLSFFDALVMSCLQMLARRSNSQLRCILRRFVPDLDPLLGPAAAKTYLKIVKILDDYGLDEDSRDDEELEALRQAPNVTAASTPLHAPTPQALPFNSPRGLGSPQSRIREGSRSAVCVSEASTGPVENLERRLESVSSVFGRVSSSQSRMQRTDSAGLNTSLGSHDSVSGARDSPRSCASDHPPGSPKSDVTSASVAALDMFHTEYPEEKEAFWGHVTPPPQLRDGYAACLECVKPQPHFGDEVGFGRHTIAPGYIVVGLGVTPPLLVASLEQSIHKNHYHPVDGKTLAYLLHPRLLKRVEPDVAAKGIVSHRQSRHRSRGQTLVQFIRWLVDVLRSPLSRDWKYFFLNLCTGNVAEPPPDVADDSSDTSGTKIVAYCLARACPVPLLRQYLSRACGYAKLQQFCERKMMRYGVYFCDCGTNRLLRKTGIRFEIVDLGAYYASGTTTEDEYYLKIINMFSEFTTHVYVQGLPSIGDLFLKWCCEYTERCPWRFIYFEGTDSTWNFIENRDRCIYKLFTSPLELQRKAQQTTRVFYTGTREAGASKRRWPELIHMHFPPRSGAEPFFGEGGVVETRYVGEWESQLEAIKDQQELLLLLVSPPGAGKTHLVETTIMAQAEHHGRRTQRIDCSNDELVELSLTYILNRKFPGETKSLLVADEFHMLDVATKEELIRWCGERQHWLQVILIANRTDENDQKLLAAARRQTNSENSVQLLNCRLRIEKVLSVYRLDSPGTRFEVFITIFFRACRSLFSDDSISLRNVGPIHALLSPDGAVPKGALAALLLSKLPHIGAYCASQFVGHVDAVYKQYGRSLDDLKYVPSTNSPLQLLVFVGLLDVQNTLCSYKEFVARLENAHKAHPCIRLAAWVHYVCHSVGVETPLLECLGQLDVIDQVGFPLIVSESGSGGLDNCLSFYKSGDYTDLEWMAEAIVHGHAMNWAQVKECWHHHYISDPTAFAHLLSVCTDPEAVLNALSPKNLCLLINASDVVLSQIVLENYTPAEGAAETEESPYYAAAWFMLRNAERSEKTFSDDWQAMIKKTTLLQVLKWASEFAFHLLDVQDDPEGRQEYCQQLLVRETNTLAGECRRDRQVLNQVISLWSNIFAPLLLAGPPDGIPYDVAYMVAKSQHPPKASWPSFVRTLCNVAHGHADPAEVDDMYEHPFFQEYLQNADPEAVFIPPEMLVAFLNLENGALSKRWQVRILTSPHVTLDERFSSLKCKKNLIEGLKALSSPDDIMAKGSLRGHLLEIYDRLFPQSKEKV